MSGQRLPVIVGFGGVNPAGRGYGHHAYARTVYEALPMSLQQRTLASLARLMRVDLGDGSGSANGHPPIAPAIERQLLDHTLVRRIEPAHFDVEAVPWNQRLPVESNGGPIRFDLARKHLPAQLPSHWEISEASVTHVHVRVTGEQPFLLPTQREFDVQSAGQLPTGFEPGALYPSRNHPRGLQMTVYAASDALRSIGIEWDTLAAHVSPDAISVYAGSGMGQLDGAGAGGMLKARANGERVTSKYCPLSFAEMPADFINAYILGSVGSTGATLGACASFLYNLRQGIDDIRSGRARVAFVGTAEAPITPEIMEGYAAMGALATKRKLCQLEGIDATDVPDFRRACRPFGDNCGFTIGESAQMLVLFDDALAMELGASMLAAVPAVYVHADGHKKSISGPGVGNYLTMARAVAATRALLGERGVQRGGLVQAHGTGTPQNRVSEAQILSKTAAAFGLDDWPVVAAKCYLGHSIGSAAGDQIANTLGIWEHGILPGITTIDAIADDVCQKHLQFSTRHRDVDVDEQRYAIINAKGFGGNNASAALMSPGATREMLQARYSRQQWQAWEQANEAVSAAQHDYDEGMIAGRIEPIYKFDHGVLQDADVVVSAQEVSLGAQTIALEVESAYDDLKIS